MKRKALHFSLISMLLIMLLVVASGPSLKAASEEPRLEWRKTYPRFPNYKAYGATVSAIDEGYLVIQTKDGGYAISAVKNDHSYPWSGGFDNRTNWLIKTDASGEVEWENEALTISAFPKSLFQTKDSGFLISGWGGVLKTDANGMAMWNKTFETWTIADGKSYYTILSAIETADGGFVFAGRIPDHPYDDAIIMKFDKNHNLLWNNTFGSDETYFSANQVIEMDNGDVAAIGSGEECWFSIFDSNGNLKQNVTFPQVNKISYHQDYFNSMIKANDEGFVLGGSYQKQGVLAKIDSEGTMKWNLTFYNPPYQGLAGLKPIGVTKDGGYLVEGGRAMVKVDDSGTLLWNVTYSNLNVGNINSMVGTEDGGFVAVGQSNSSIMLTKFAPEKDAPSFTSPLSTIWIAVPIIVIIVAVSILIYFKRRKR